MKRLPIAAAVAACLPALADGPAAYAHAIAGARVFPVTLTIDDPGVADEASIPTFTWQQQEPDSDTGTTYQYNVTAEFDKRITEHLGIGVNGGYTIQTAKGAKTQTGFQNINVTLKYQAWVNGPHEAIVSLGVTREFARTGTAHTGADQYGSTTPTVYFGKGFGDLPIPALRPFAITGTAGYTIADKKLKAIDTGTGDLGTNAGTGVTGLAAQQFNNGFANRWIGGLSLQYSLPYLRSQVRDIGLPEFFNRLTPLVEVAYSSPASQPSNLGTQVVFAPGVIYQGDSYQFGIEALIPGNRASGRYVGVITQLHLFFDDLFPNSLGKPLFSY
jgi:hypothetical protein